MFRQGGGRLLKCYNSNPDEPNPDALLTQAFIDQKVQNIHFSGLELMSALNPLVVGLPEDQIYKGDLCYFYGDDLVFDRCTVSQFREGRAFLLGGDRIRMMQPKVYGSPVEPNAGGIRYFGGTDFQCIGPDIISGDDALQLVPLFGGDNANLPIKRASYIGGKAYSTAGRAMIAFADENYGAMVDPNDPVSFLDNAIEDFSFIGIQGRGSSRTVTLEDNSSFWARAKNQNGVVADPPATGVASISGIGATSRDLNMAAFSYPDRSFSTLPGGQIGIDPNKPVIEHFRVGDKVEIVGTQSAVGDGIWAITGLSPDQPNGTTKYTINKASIPAGAIVTTANTWVRRSVTNRIRRGTIEACTIDDSGDQSANLNGALQLLGPVKDIAVSGSRILGPVRSALFATTLPHIVAGNPVNAGPRDCRFSQCLFEAPRSAAFPTIELAPAADFIVESSAILGSSVMATHLVVLGSQWVDGKQPATGAQLIDNTFADVPNGIYAVNCTSSSTFAEIRGNRFRQVSGGSAGAIRVLMNIAPPPANGTSCVISGNDLRQVSGVAANASAKIQLAVDSKARCVGNIGNVGGATGVPTLSASPATYTTGAYEEYISITGGTVTQIKVANVQVALATPWYGRVPPLTAIQITYTAAPVLRFGQAVEA